MRNVPATPSLDGDFQAVADPAPPGLDSDPAPPMSLYPGDVVTLRMISAETEEVEGLTVDARGMLHVPLAGDVQVGEMPLAEAEQHIEEAMRRYDETVRVTIIMEEPAGHQATVIGAVGEQGRVAVVPGMRVADLLAAAGGPTAAEEDGVPAPAADLHLARLVRNGAPVPVSIAIAITGDSRHNIRILPGDYLYVPAQLGSLLTILGEVNEARVLAYQPGIRLSQALAMAGGITRDANGGDIHIVRNPGPNPSIYHAAIDHVIAGDAPDPVLAPGDIVYVGSSAAADVGTVLSALAPLLSVVSTTAFVLGLRLR